MDASITANKIAVCNNGLAIEVMRQQQLLVTKLRALVLPLLRADEPSTVLAFHLFEDVISCNTSVISKLQLVGNTSIDDKLTVSKSTTGDSNVEGEQQKPMGRKRRRNEKQSRSFITDAPHYDGLQWRKYGQKSINGMQHPRSYYRCTYSKEQNCSAAKTIQQRGNNNSTTCNEHIVVYYGNHTCNQSNDHKVEHPYIVGPDHQNLLMSLEMEEFTMNSEVSTLLQEFIDVPVDPCSWVMDEMIGFEQASSPVYVGGFIF